MGLLSNDESVTYVNSSENHANELNTSGHVSLSFRLYFPSICNGTGHALLTGLDLRAILKEVANLLLSIHLKLHFMSISSGLA